MAIYQVTPEGYLRVHCAWCGCEVNPSMSTGFDETPRIADAGFHFSCIEALETAARTLASNLAIGAALCASFILGNRDGQNEVTISEGCNPEFPDWRPGYALRPAISEGT